MDNVLARSASLMAILDQHIRGCKLSVLCAGGDVWAAGYEKQQSSPWASILPMWWQHYSMQHEQQPGSRACPGEPDFLGHMLENVAHQQDSLLKTC